LSSFVGTLSQQYPHGDRRKMGRQNFASALEIDHNRSMKNNGVTLVKKYAP